MGMASALAAPRKIDRCRSKIESPRYSRTCANVLAEFVGRLDAKRLMVKIAEGAGVERTAHGGLQHQGQILIGRQNADRRIDFRKARRIRSGGGAVELRGAIDHL